MRKTIRTLTAGFEGATRGLLIAAVVCAIIVVLPTILASIASHGAFDLDMFVPRSMRSASQAATVSIEGSFADRRTVRRALDGLVWSVRSPRPTIVVTSAKDLPLDAVGTYALPENIIRINKDVMQDPVGQGLSYILAHEIGHQLDTQYLDDSGRFEFMRLRGRDPQQAWDGQGVAWAESPMEDFAEVFAALDAPLSHVVIRTNGGRIENHKELRALIQRYQRGASRTAAAQAITSLPLLSALSHDQPIEPRALLALLGVAMVCTVSGSVRSMQVVRTKRTRTPRSRRRNHTGKVLPVSV